MNPTPILIGVITVITFQAILYGTSVQNPQGQGLTFPTAPERYCQSTDLSCNLARAVDYIVYTFVIIGTTVYAFLSIISFNIPGAPIEVRLLVSATIVTAIAWAVAGLVRGGGTQE